MKTQHIIVMVLATVATIYIGTGVITKSVGVAGRIGRLVEDANAGDERDGEDLGRLIEDLAATSADEEKVPLARDPMVPKTKEEPKPQVRSTEPPKPAHPSLAVTAVIIDDENPMAVISTGGRSITVEEGDTVNGGQVVEIESDGVVIEYDDGSRTYPYPSGN